MVSDLGHALQQAALHVENYSDAYLHTGKCLAVRDSVLRIVRLNDVIVHPRWMHELLGLAEHEDVSAQLRRHGGSVEDTVEIAGRRYRVSVCLTGGNGNVSAVMRPMRVSPPSMAELGLPSSFTQFVEAPQGLVLICGPSGAGKSHTLAALVDYVNSNFPRHVITIEDPIELQHESKTGLVMQRAIGECESYARGVRDALRQSPDIIVIGEIRDRATMAEALHASEAGRLVLGTLHAGSVARTVERVIDFAPEGERELWRAQLANNVMGVLVQSLIRDSEEKGRVLATEVVMRSPQLTSLIATNQTSKIEEMIRQTRNEEMNTWLLNHSLAAHVGSARIKLGVAASVTYDRRGLADALGMGLHDLDQLAEAEAA